MDHQGRPETIARGKTATTALKDWTRGYLLRQDALASQRRARTVYRIGTGVWYWMALPQGGHQWIRAAVCGHDALTCRIFVVGIDDQRLQFYANPNKVIRRYDGELAPGIVPSETTGRPTGRRA